MRTLVVHPADVPTTDKANSKRGNKRIRAALILSVWMAIRNNTEMACHYERYKSEGKHSNKAIVKIKKVTDSLVVNLVGMQGRARANFIL